MVYLTIPSIPPSSNMAYFTKGHLRVLTTEGRRYKNETVAHLSQKYRKEMMIFKKDCAYQFFFKFWLETIQNKLWKSGGKVNKYKKEDGSNKIKLIEDCLSEAGGFDDSQVIRSIWNKVSGTPARTEIWVWNLDEEADPFDFDYILKSINGPVSTD